MSFTWLSGTVKYDEDERTQTWVVADEFKPKKIDEETQEFMDAISDEIIQLELEKMSEEDDDDLL